MRIKNKKETIQSPLDQPRLWINRLMVLSLSITLQAKSCQEHNHSFAKTKDVYQYSALINNLRDISADSTGTNVLYDAVKFGNEEQVKYVLQRLNQDKASGYSYTANPSFPNSINRNSKKSPLGQAIESGQRKIVKLLIENEYITPNQVGNHATALVAAIQKNKEPIAMDLWKHYIGKTETAKLDITQPDASGKTALHWAIQHAYQPLTKLLIQKLSENHAIDQIYTKDRKGRTPLHIAARYNNYQAFEQLFKLLAKKMGGNAQAINMLFEKDHRRGNTIFAYAYLPASFTSKVLEIIHIANKDFDTFHNILKLVKSNLTKQQWQAIEAEMLTLSSKYLNKAYAAKLRALLQTYRPKSNLKLKQD